MSKLQVTHNVQFAAKAASCFKQSDITTRREPLSNNVSPAAISGKNKSALLSLTAMLLYGLALPVSAQTPAVSQIAAEKGFTLPPNVQTPIVLQTEPDADCDLHSVGDVAHTMKLYASPDGYVRVHVDTEQESRDVRMQLDCATGGKVTRYPLHFRTGSPTADMPAPQISVPTPKGAQVLPALTDQEAQRLSDDYLISLGYPPRPDAAASPDNYSTWLDLVSRPITLVPSHSVSRSDITHQVLPGQAGPEAGTFTSGNWSGYEAHGAKRSYLMVEGTWAVPTIAYAEAGHNTYSAFWVGLDGDGTADLEQAGTEQDTYEAGGLYFTSYTAWTELVPNQPTEQVISGLSANPGDNFYVEVWIGGSALGRAPNQNGGYAWFYVYNMTQHQASETSTPLGSTYFTGSEAEWIMERPLVGGTYAELSDYVSTSMIKANVEAIGTSVWTPSGTAANRQLLMYNSFINYPDNNELSKSKSVPPTGLNFYWLNFH